MVNWGTKTTDARAPMTLPNKFQRLLNATKAELTSFTASGSLAVIGAGLELGAPLLKQAAPAHSMLGMVGEGAESIGKMLQTVAVPAAGATFIALVTKFGKAWRDLTQARAPRKPRMSAPRNKPTPDVTMFDCSFAGCEG